MIVFFDASALIYLIEGKEPFAGKVRSELVAATGKYPNVGAAVSRLTWLECRVGPIATLICQSSTYGAAMKSQEF